MGCNITYLIEQQKTDFDAYTSLKVKDHVRPIYLIKAIRRGCNSRFGQNKLEAEDWRPHAPRESNSNKKKKKILFLRKFLNFSLISG